MLTICSYCVKYYIILYIIAITAYKNILFKYTHYKKSDHNDVFKTKSYHNIILYNHKICEYLISTFCVKYYITLYIIAISGY
jgi:hypothetical protein